jgi:hypothetical protein
MRGTQNAVPKRSVGSIPTARTSIIAIGAMSGSSSFIEHMIATATSSRCKGVPSPREARPRPPPHPPDDPGSRGHSCPPTRNSRVRPTAGRTPGLSHHVFRVSLLRLPGDFARAAKSAGRLTFRPSGNSIKRELIRPPRPSITKRVPTGNRSGRPILLPLTRPSHTTRTYLQS